MMMHNIKYGKLCLTQDSFKLFFDTITFGTQISCGTTRDIKGNRLKAKRGIYEMNKDFYRPRLSCHAANIKLFYHTGFKPNSFFSLIFSKSNLSGKNQFYNAIFQKSKYR